MPMETFIKESGKMAKLKDLESSMTRRVACIMENGFKINTMALEKNNGTMERSSTMVTSKMVKRPAKVNSNLMAMSMKVTSSTANSMVKESTSSQTQTRLTLVHS